MYRIWWTILLLTALVLNGCGSLSTPVGPATFPSTAGTITPTAVTNSGSVTASVKMVPAQQSNLSFIISAPIKEINIKEGDPVKAGQALMVLDTPDLMNAVAGAQASVQAQQEIVELMNYPYKKIFSGGRITYVKAYVERRQQAQAELDAAQASLDIANFKLQQGTLTAPYDGTIVAIEVKVGELVQPGEVVAIIGTLDRLQVQTTDLSERSIANVQVGQKAVVQLKSYDQDLTGKVTAVSPMGTPSNGDIVFRVTIELDAPPSNLMWGMSGHVTIQTQP